MDELLKQVAQLIATGGDLANDALYLYFATKLVGPWAVTTAVLGSVHIVCRTILRSIELEKAK